MDFILESIWLRIAFALPIAVSVAALGNVILTKVVKPGALGSALAFILSLCVWLTTSTFNTNQSIENFLISSMGWGFFGIALYSAKMYRAIKS